MASARTLVLLRHAKSDWSGDEADIDRPLGKRGRREAPEAGQWLAHGVKEIDLAIVSPANRTRSTWDLVVAELAVCPPMQVNDQVYDASDSELLDVVRQLPDEAETVVLVGHNPGMEGLVRLLTGESVPMPTSGVAVIALAGRWSATAKSAGTLLASGRPPP